MRRHSRAAAAFTVAAAIMLSAQPLAFAQGEDAGDLPTIVATTEVLGSIASEVAGDAAEVVTLMESGANPHQWAPSARDVERMMEATLIVENGFDLEEGLLDALDQARAEGIPVFTASDYVVGRLMGEGHDHEADHAEGDHAEGDHAEGDHAEGDHDDGHQHAAEAEDPHIWLDPVGMRAVVEAMIPALDALGIDVGEQGAAYIAELDTLDAEITQLIATIPEDRRTVVADHIALGYFGDRYGLEQIGAVLPSVSTAGEPSAQDIAALISTMEEAGVDAVFTSIGTPEALSQTVAEAVGGEVVRLSMAQLPADGSYVSLIRDIAQSIAGALGD